MSAPALPPGFVLDAPPALPAGFVLDAPAKEPGLLARVGDAITGSLRSTPESDALPDWASMPELNSLSMASAKTGLGTMLSNPEETAQIIKANFPQAEVRQDENGNFIIRSAADGKEYAIKPGFRVSDIPRALGALAAFTPAGRAGSIARVGVASAGTQAVIEGTQAATGGEFGRGDVAIAGALGAAGPALVTAVRSGAPLVRAGIQRITGRAPAAPQVPAVPATQPMPGIPPATPALPVPQIIPDQAVATLPADELAQATRTAALGGIGSNKATAVVASEVAPDRELLAAADRLGITEFLQPDHYTTNQAFRQISQLVKSQTGSEAAAAQKAGLLRVSEAADDIITKLGGSNDLSTLDETVRSTMRSSIDTLKAAATKEFDKLAEVIPPKTPAPAQSLLTFINQRADDLGGIENLTGTERTLLARLSPKADGRMPTYALLDDQRKALNLVKYGKGEEAFKGAGDRLLDDLIGAMREDQGQAAKAVGLGDTWELAQGLSKQYLGVQKDMASLFGAALDQSLARTGAGGLPGAVRVLAKGDSQRLLQLLKVTPPELRQQVTTSGVATFFARSARSGEMNWGSYAQWHDGLKTNRQAYTALMANLPAGAAQQLDDIAKVAKGIAMSKGEFIATGKALNPSALDAAESFAGKVFDEVRRRGMTGLLAEGIGTASGAPGLATALQSSIGANKTPIMKAADQLITSPEFLKAARAAGTPEGAAAARALANSSAFARFVRAANSPREFSNREQWVLQALQANQQRQ